MVLHTTSDIKSSRKKKQYKAGDIKECLQPLHRYDIPYPRPERSLKTPPSRHQLFDLQDSLDKLMQILPHSCQILSPSKTGLNFIVSAHRLINITLLTLMATL